jgi:hypothetical protein
MKQLSHTWVYSVHHSGFSLTRTGLREALGGAEVLMFLITTERAEVSLVVENQRLVGLNHLMAVVTDKSVTAGFAVY